jgi:hypothetical protein
VILTKHYFGGEGRGGGHIVEKKGIHTCFVRQPEGQKPHGRPTPDLTINIGQFLKKYDGIVWTG